GGWPRWRACSGGGGCFSPPPGWAPGGAGPGGCSTGDTPTPRGRARGWAPGRAPAPPARGAGAPPPPPPPARRPPTPRPPPSGRAPLDASARAELEDLRRRAFASADAREARAALREKRPPRWKGR